MSNDPRVDKLILEVEFLKRRIEKLESNQDANARELRHQDKQIYALRRGIKCQN